MIATRKVLISCIVIILVSSAISPLQIASATNSWSDDFEDQDLDSWIITRGVFSAEQKTLWAYGTEFINSNRAYHECNITTGRWKFDILLNSKWIWRFHPPSIRFMVNSTDDILWQGYVLDFYTLTHPEQTILSVYLRAHTDSWKYLAHFDFDCIADGWQQIDIIRNPAGRITVFLNSTQIIDITDTSIKTSKYFVFDTEDCVETVYDPDTHTDSFIRAKESPMLDNIVVYEIPGFASTTLPTFFFIISIIGCSIALIVIVRDELENRRMKPNENGMLQ
jgi:hypothetical protein